MNEDIMKSASFLTLSFESGEIRFAGLARGWDEGMHEVFVVKLPGRPPLFGEWRQKWADNGNDFNIEIVGFGFADAKNVFNHDSVAMQQFSKQESIVIKALISALFSNDEARMEVIPVTKFPSHFLKRVEFLPGWIRD